MKRLNVAQPAKERLERIGLSEKNVITAMLDTRSVSGLSETNALGEHENSLTDLSWQSPDPQGSVEAGGRPVDENMGKDELEKLIRKMLGDAVTEQDIAKISGLWQNPAAMGQLFSQMQNMFSGSGEPVNWKLASDQATELAKKNQQDSPAVSSELQSAFDMAALWLHEVTEFSNSQPLKVLSRATWVLDAMQLYKQLSEPVALSMSKVLTENLDKLMPEELSQMMGPAKSFISNAGASIFAMQLGQAVGRLSNQTLMGSEIGIPISPRPAMVSQNIAVLIADLATPRSEVMIFLATRELAISSLYSSNRWLGDHIITQVREFAAGLKVDVEQIQTLAEGLDPNDQESLNQLMQAGALISQPTPEQERTLARIELTLALIEGWADYISESACKRLPSIASITELYNRHRASSGAMEKTFQTLLGLEIRPKFRREAKQMWQLVNQRLGKSKTDALWSHPDLLPSEQEVKNPEELILRLGSPGDDFDSELRKLLDG
jgi:putative hydrolase